MEDGRAPFCSEADYGGLVDPGWEIRSGRRASNVLCGCFQSFAKETKVLRVGKEVLERQ